MRIVIAINVVCDVSLLPMLLHSAQYFAAKFLRLNKIDGKTRHDEFPRAHKQRRDDEDDDGDEWK